MDTLRFFVDCTFDDDPLREAMTADMLAVSKKMGFAQARIESGGGAVCNACDVLENPPALYVKPPKPALGSGCSWDFAATACLFKEAGGYAREYGGGALELNSSTHTFFNHCGICFASDVTLGQAFQAASK